MKDSGTTRTAVLLFAHNSAEEEKHKFLPGGGELWSALQQQAIRTIERSGLEYFHFSEEEQRGKDFAARFINALSEVFFLGYDRVIAIGNDSPGLKAQDLQCAADSIAAGSAVVGPSTDGGFYLLGLHKSDFDPEMLALLPWQQANLHRALTRKLRNSGIEISQLGVLHDIDNTEDLEIIATSINIIPIGILMLIRSLLGGYHAHGLRVDSYYYTPELLALHNRGSPITA